jgi:hypothetical protein
MIALLREARTATVGVFRMFAFRDDWKSYFDFSAEGVGRSFAGVVLSLPAFVFTVFAIDYFVADNPNTVPPDTRMTLMEAALTWARYWLVFPIVAAGLCLAAGMTKKYAAWLVTQNWTVFVLVHIQALIFAFYPAGLSDPASLGQLTQVYIVARALAFWRVAAGALETPVGLSAAFAGIIFLVDWTVRAAT